MSVLHVKYLLAGGGAASTAAAKAIRSLDADGSILMVGQEVHRAYLRPELSRGHLRREVGRDRLYVDDPNWMEQHHVHLRTGRRVSRVDPPRSAATLDSGEEISYDQLLIVTGATPTALNIPGAELPNLFYLRTVDDVERLGHAIDKAKLDGRPHPNAAGKSPVPRGRAVVIGGGLLGVEVAASLTQLGLAVDLVIAETHPWARQAGDATGRFVRSVLERHGVTVHTDAPPQRLEGDGRVQRVVLDQASRTVIDCDLAVACVGVTPNKDLLRNTAIAGGQAILVDAGGRTNISNIFAAGDCAAILDPRFGKHRWLDYWEGGLAMATLAGRNMAGADEQFAALPAFDTRFSGLVMRGWGEARLVDRRLIRGSTAADSTGFAEIGIAADGRVAQVLVVGEVSDRDDLWKLVLDRAHVSGREESLRDPNARLAC